MALWWRDLLEAHEDQVTAANYAHVARNALNLLPFSNFYSRIDLDVNRNQEMAAQYYQRARQKMGIE